MPKGKGFAGRTAINAPMLRVANVQDESLDLTDVHEIQIEPNEFESYSLRDGDLLMNEGGDNDKLGRGAIWKYSISPCTHQNQVFEIRLHSIKPGWLDQLARADYAKFHFFRVPK